MVTTLAPLSQVRKVALKYGILNDFWMTTKINSSFSDMPSQLYPTVGLQTPGEIIDANFGQEPFIFDIEGEMQEIRSRIHRTIENFPYSGKHGEWQLLLNR